ncbi:universal stress protein [Marinilabilia rubra]|uniref:Universal stress protein n=1 Tax=Marinilabilia rubra TaxID=2162893 RepID=A0A2U2B785_9BACT|nr:universal stress protein [Marinilabilia rubra]PWD98941.1 universal stress protein [Marinilabilia rubra]
MKRIILLTDFSEAARNASLYALKMYEKENVHFQLLNIFDVEFSGSPYIMQVKEEMAEESMRGLRRELSLLHAQYPNARIELASRFGAMTEVIRKELEEYEPELTVLGCKGESALEHFLLGSNALEIIKHVHFPMMVIPVKAKFSPPEKIVFATDLKEVDISRMATPLNNLVKAYNSELLFLNVLEEEYVNRVEAEEKIASYFPGIKLSFHFIDHNGDLCKSILKFMDENGAKMLTLVRHHHNFFQRMFNPHVIQKMIRHPHHPMIILHEQEQTEN